MDATAVLLRDVSVEEGERAACNIVQHGPGRHWQGSAARDKLWARSEVLYGVRRR
jgi:hypothetical protein